MLSSILPEAFPSYPVSITAAQHGLATCQPQGMRRGGRDAKRREAAAKPKSKIIKHIIALCCLLVLVPLPSLMLYGWFA
jgi:hypothetical protein